MREIVDRAWSGHEEEARRLDGVVSIRPARPPRGYSTSEEIGGRVASASERIETRATALDPLGSLLAELRDRRDR